jgi:NADH:ubiquinone oxidoreductase subunit C
MSTEASRRIDPDQLASRLSEFGARVSTESSAAGPTRYVVEVDSERSLEVLTLLRDDESTSMRRLVDLTAVDRLGRADSAVARFVIVYQLHSPTSQQRLRVEALLRTESAGDPDPPSLESVSKLWPAAIWLECEVFDLFGIRFSGHPDLRRILLDADFEGAPLRKDHPLKIDRALPVEDAS